MIVFLSIILAISNIACSNKGQTSNMFSWLKNKNNDDIRYRDDNKTSKVFKLSVVLNSDKYFIDVTAYTSIENVITQVKKLSGQRIESLAFKNNVLSRTFNLGDYEINKSGYKLTGKAGSKINKHSNQTQINDSKRNILENSNSISGITNIQSINPRNQKKARILNTNINNSKNKPIFNKLIIDPKRHIVRSPLVLIAGASKYDPPANNLPGAEMDMNTLVNLLGYEYHYDIKSTFDILNNHEKNSLTLLRLNTFINNQYNYLNQNKQKYDSLIFILAGHEICSYIIFSNILILQNVIIIFIFKISFLNHFRKHSHQSTTTL